MGCASSTPMITSGSEMLKAATHVAEDAAKSAENAVQDVTQSLGKSIETAKETVGTAVTDIAHDLGNAFKDKTEEAKNNLLETFNLNGEREAAIKSPVQNLTGALQKQHVDGDITDDGGDDEITERLSRAPTPTPFSAVYRAIKQDTDSLKTSTPEPEIEQALANQTDENSPPTPQPNISELERLSAELNQTKTETDLIADVHNAMANNEQSKSEKNTSESTIQRRPSTTEWEKYADMLAKNQKFHPNEIALRRRMLGANGTLAKIMTTGQVANGILKTNEINSAQIAENTTTANATKDSVPKIHIPQYFRDFTRPKTEVTRTQNDIESGQSDRNYGSTSSSSPIKRSKMRVLRKRIPRAFTTTAAKKMHRQLTTLIGLPLEKSTSSAGFRIPFVNGTKRTMHTSRNFDYNPNRVRIGSPLTRKHNKTVLPPFRYYNSSAVNLSSPLQLNAMRKLNSSSSSTSRIGLHSFGHLYSPIMKTASRSLSRSSRSSTNNSVPLKSNCTTPVSRSASKSSLKHIIDINASDNVPELLADKQSIKYANSKFSRSSSPILGVIEDFRFVGHGDSCVSVCSNGRRTPNKLINSPKLIKNTSSFLSSPRNSPFLPRKSYTEYNDKENNAKAVFIADLSSVNDNRNLLTPSPYKMRERCAVCYNKYIVK